MLARVRGAADRPGHRRGAARVHREAQGGDARLRGLGRACCSAAATLARARARGARRGSSPTRRSSSCRSRTPATRRPRSCRRRHGVGDGVAGEGHRGDRRAVRAAPGAPASGRSRTSRRGWSATARTSPSCIAWLEGAGVDRAFVVGGDAKEPGEFLDGLSLLRAMAEIGHPLPRSASRATRRATPYIADGPLLEALRDKAPFASYMTTQLCFDPGAIATLDRGPPGRGDRTCRSKIGVPGVAEPHKLLSISARIGVADTTGSYEEPPLRRRGCCAPAASTARRPARGARAASSPTRRPASSASTCTRSTRSRRPADGSWPARSTAGPRPAARRRMRGDPACSVAARLGHHLGTQLKSAYPEWRRDRPVEATTTYRRRAGKVPIPGRFSCAIRDLSQDPSGGKGLSVSGHVRPIHRSSRGPMADTHDVHVPNPRPPA